MEGGNGARTEVPPMPGDFGVLLGKSIFINVQISRLFANSENVLSYAVQRVDLVAY